MKPKAHRLIDKCSDRATLAPVVEAAPNKRIQQNAATVDCESEALGVC